MKVAVIGSRRIKVLNLRDYLPDEVSEIVSGGARGVDACAKAYALSCGIAYREFLPEYARYKRGAPLKRNRQIVDYADFVIAFWDGKSRGTKHSVDYCRESGKNVRVILVKERERGG